MRITHCSSKTIILTGVLLLLNCGFWGCGVKGPPVPPRQPPLPVVADLAYQVVGQRVTLTWSLQESLAGKQARQAIFVLHRSMTALDEPACDGCPLVFEKVATVPYVHTDGDRFATDVPLNAGYHYVFKVRLETDRGVGPDSNPVQFDHLPQVPSRQRETP